MGEEEKEEEKKDEKRKKEGTRKETRRGKKGSKGRTADKTCIDKILDTQTTACLTNTTHKILTDNRVGHITSLQSVQIFGYLERLLKCFTM